MMPSPADFRPTCASFTAHGFAPAATRLSAHARFPNGEAAAMSADHKMADGTERLAKRVAVQQSCSRADAERYIEGGWIAVDGRVVEEPGFRVGASQTVSLLPGARLERCGR